MELSSRGGHMIPEQVWDRPDIPDLELFLGKPTGSACPLVWAHSEYIRLRRSLRDGKVFDLPAHAVQRYQVEKQKAEFFGWRFNNKCRTMPQGKKLRIVLLTPAQVRYSFDAWKTTQNISSRDTGLGVQAADLATDKLPSGKVIAFTFFWPQENRWENENYEVLIQ